MSRYKVAIMTTNYLPSVGGLVSYARSLSKSCSEEACVDIFCTNGGDKKLKKKEVIEGVNVFRVNVKVLRFLIFSPLVIFLSSLIQVLINFNRLKSKDVIIVRHFYYAAALSFIPSLNRRAVFIAPLIAEKLFKINMSNERNLVRTVYDYIVLFFIKIIERRAFKNTKHVAVLSSSKKVEVEHYFSIQNVKVIAPGFDPERFNTANLDNTFLEDELNDFIEKAKQQSKKVILTVCRLVEEKNIETLISALSGSSNYALLVVGDGPLMNKLKCVANNVSLQSYFAGFRTDVEKYYKLADLFVLPSTYEGFGHVYLEALGCGCPCAGLMSKPPEIITATEEIIKDGKNGVLIKDNTPEDFLNAIDKVKHIELSRDEISSDTLMTFSWSIHLNKSLSIVNDFV